MVRPQPRIKFFVVLKGETVSEAIEASGGWNRGFGHLSAAQEIANWAREDGEDVACIVRIERFSTGSEYPIY